MDIVDGVIWLEENYDWLIGDKSCANNQSDVSRLLVGEPELGVGLRRRRSNISGRHVIDGHVGN